jgi:sortase (surface protein transpeptidase)
LLTTVFLATALTLAGIPVIWMAWYRLSPGTSERLAAILQKPVVSLGQVLVDEGVKEEPVVYQPPQDATLPAENRIKIDVIGLDTQIVEEPVERYEEAFKLGVWRVPDFGDAFYRERPMILAAHRFGYLAWTNQYRRENSFFNLPKLKSGDQIQIIWNQRRYLYEIYAGDEGEQITDYTADMILYTCKFLESTDRIFRYARLIEKGYFEIEADGL